MNRFSRKQSSRDRVLAMLLPVCIFVLIMFFFVQGMSSIARSTSAETKRSLETAIERSIVHCYAIEGRYPPSLQYLKDHYGITYDETAYYVNYQPVAANIRPDVVILPLEGAHENP